MKILSDLFPLKSLQALHCKEQIMQIIHIMKKVVTKNQQRAAVDTTIILPLSAIRTSRP